MPQPPRPYSRCSRRSVARSGAPAGCRRPGSRTSADDMAATGGHASQRPRMPAWRRSGRSGVECLCTDRVQRRWLSWDPPWSPRANHRGSARCALIAGTDCAAPSCRSVQQAARHQPSGRAESCGGSRPVTTPAVPLPPRWYLHTVHLHLPQTTPPAGHGSQTPRLSAPPLNGVGPLRPDHVLLSGAVCISPPCRPAHGALTSAVGLTLLAKCMQLANSFQTEMRRIGCLS